MQLSGEELEARIAEAGSMAVAGAYAVALGLVGTWAVLASDPLGPRLVLVALLGLGFALGVDRLAAHRLEARRAAGEQSYLRLLQGLSRSVSPDAVVSAIVDELRHSTGADHVVVTRARPADNLLEATLFASAGDAPPGTTYLPAELLAPIPRQRRAEDGRVPIPVVRPTAGPGAAHLRRTLPAPTVDTAATDISARIADRLRDAFGLRNMLAVPLVADRTVVGSLTLSRRTGEPWPPTVRGLLDAAAAEVAAALVRVYAFQAAELRASLDGLTGLPNRRHFDELAAVVAQGRRRIDGMGVLMIDIDHFKRLNDRYSHLVGDRVLRAVAAAIAASVRGDDTPARYGGEEFVVVLRRARLIEAVEIAERIRRAVAAIPVGEFGVEGRVTVSVGVAVAPSGSDRGDRPGRPDPDAPRSLPELVERADRALFRAKRAGRDRVIVDEPRRSVAA